MDGSSNSSPDDIRIVPLMARIVFFDCLDSLPVVIEIKSKRE
jgi:hypothetical protein